MAAIAHQLGLHSPTTLIGRQWRKWRRFLRASDKEIAWIRISTLVATMPQRRRGGLGDAGPEPIHAGYTDFAIVFTGKDSEAQDLDARTCFLRVFKSLKSYRSDEGAFVTWLDEAEAENLLIDHYRRKRQERLTDSIEEQLADD